MKIEKHQPVFPETILEVYPVAQVIKMMRMLNLLVKKGSVKNSKH